MTNISTMLSYQREKYIEDYIEDMKEMERLISEYTEPRYRKSLNTPIGYDKRASLFDKEDMKLHLNKLFDYVLEHPSASEDEIRRKIYELSGVEDAIRDYVFTKQFTPGLVTSFGTKNFTQEFYCGNRVDHIVGHDDSFIEFEDPIKPDAIFDLASPTKMFTGVAMLKLISESNGAITLDTRIGDICDDFPNLKDSTIFDILCFQQYLETEKVTDKNGKDSFLRIDDPKIDAQEALRRLKNVKPSEEDRRFKNPYSDMGAMVLKYIIEKASGMRYKDYLEKKIFIPAEMIDTTYDVPENKLHRVVSTDGAVIIGEKDGEVTATIKRTPLGVPYDGKAQKLPYSGHAGLFSTVGDLNNFAEAIINNKILDSDTSEYLFKKATGRLYTTEKINGVDVNREWVRGDKKRGFTKKNVQTFGPLVYLKNPDGYSSEVDHFLSGKTFASSGYNGTHIAIDYISGIHTAFLSSKCNCRIPSVPKKIPSNCPVIKLENGTRLIAPTNRGFLIDTSRAAWQKDKVNHALARAAHMMRFAELTLPYFNRCNTESKPIQLVKAA